jgi:hypothetical protein
MRFMERWLSVDQSGIKSSLLHNNFVYAPETDFIIYVNDLPSSMSTEPFRSPLARMVVFFMRIVLVSMGPPIYFKIEENNINIYGIIVPL